MGIRQEQPQAGRWVPQHSSFGWKGHGVATEVPTRLIQKLNLKSIVREINRQTTTSPENTEMETIFEIVGRVRFSVLHKKKPRLRGGMKAGRVLTKPPVLSIYIATVFYRILSVSM